MTYWKLLNGMEPIIADTDYRYPGRGRWTRRIDPDTLKRCRVGYHVMEDQQLLTRIQPGTLWECEIDPDTEPLRFDDEVVTARLRLIEPHVVSQRCLVLWAADCAEHVLSLFEDRFPDDSRPRTALEVARTAGAADAAGAAAAAADAAGAAGAAGAAWALGAAARAAWAAGAAGAARGAERWWQYQALITAIKGDET